MIYFYITLKMASTLRAARVSRNIAVQRLQTEGMDAAKWSLRITEAGRNQAFIKIYPGSRDANLDGRRPAIPHGGFLCFFYCCPMPRLDWRDTENWHRGIMTLPQMLS
jgi:hypothetical protein